MDIHEISKIVLEKLKDLPVWLTYHNQSHTLDVYHQVVRIAYAEGYTDKRTIFLLQIAALYHDTGFLETYDDHEEVSCKIFESDAPKMNLKAQEITLIKEMIMATKAFVTPTTNLQKIICDADLDYVGRDDFFKIGNGLAKELISCKKISNDLEWQQLQLNFLAMHQFYTLSSQLLRAPVKKRNYELLFH